MPAPINNLTAPTLTGTMQQATPEDLTRITQIANGRLSQQEMIPILAMMGAFNQDISAAQDPNDPNSLRARTLAAQAALKEAASQYDAAATAPRPEVSGASQTVSRALSGVASVLTGNKSFIENARSDIQNQEKALMDSRIQNLTRLRDIQQAKAEAAEKSGQFEVEEVSRLKKDKFDKAIALLQDQLNNKEAMRRASMTANKPDDLRGYMAKVVDDWRQNRDANAFREIRDARDRALVLKPGNSQDDNTLIQVFAKMIDEKTGVRQNEAAAIADAAGWIQKQLNMPNALSGRGTLVPEARASIMRQVNDIFMGYLPKYEIALADARKVEAMYGITNSVITDYAQDYRNKKAAQDATPAGQAAGRLTGGQSTPPAQTGTQPAPQSTKPSLRVSRENLGKKNEKGETLVYSKITHNYYFLTDEELKRINPKSYEMKPIIR